MKEWMIKEVEWRTLHIGLFDRERINLSIIIYMEHKGEGDIVQRKMMEIEKNSDSQSRVEDELTNRWLNNEALDHQGWARNDSWDCGGDERGRVLSRVFGESVGQGMAVVVVVVRTRRIEVAMRIEALAFFSVWEANHPGEVLGLMRARKGMRRRSGMESVNLESCLTRLARVGLQEGDVIVWQIWKVCRDCSSSSFQPWCY